MDWNDVRYFLSVARTGSLTRTASALHVSQSTVARRIQTLEDMLGTHLFARHQTGYFLTDHGRDLLARAEAVEDTIVAFEMAATRRDGDASGLVRLATAENIATHLIVPALPELLQQYPGIRLEITTAIETVGLARNEADMALRLVRPTHGNLKIRKVGEMGSALYGSASYVDRHYSGAPGSLDACAFIKWDDAHTHIPAARWLDEHYPDVLTAVRLNSLAAQLAAVQAGLGLAVLPCFLAETKSELTRVTGVNHGLSEDLWLVTHADLSASARIRVVGDFLMMLLARAGNSFQA